MYSLNKKGPCINGGNLTCKGDEVAPAITCRCPPQYKGMFCEEKMENVKMCLFTIISSSLSICANLFDKHKCKHDGLYIIIYCHILQITKTVIPDNETLWYNLKLFSWHLKELQVNEKRLCHIQQERAVCFQV